VAVWQCDGKLPAKKSSEAESLSKHLTFGLSAKHQGPVGLYTFCTRASSHQEGVPDLSHRSRSGASAIRKFVACQSSLKGLLPDFDPTCQYGHRSNCFTEKPLANSVCCVAHLANLGVNRLVIRSSPIYACCFAIGVKVIKP
jgi:hypothetical protein